MGKASSQQSKNHSGKSGYVYVLDMGCDGLYKIGKAGNFDNRFSALQSANPKLRAVLAERVHNMHHAEKSLHKLFKSQRQKREWFTLVPDDLEKIKSFLKSHAAPTIPDSLVYLRTTNSIAG